MILETGKHYWMRQEDVFDAWRPCKVFAFGGEQFIQPTGCTPCKVSKMDLDSCEFVEIMLPDLAGELIEALYNIFDALDANNDERCGLSSKEWGKIIAEAKDIYDKVGGNYGP